MINVGTIFDVDAVDGTAEEGTKLKEIDEEGWETFIIFRDLFCSYKYTCIFNMLSVFCTQL